MVEDDALDEHPQEHCRLPVLDQRVERLTQEGLQKHTKHRFLVNSYLKDLTLIICSERLIFKFTLEVSRIFWIGWVNSKIGFNLNPNCLANCPSFTTNFTTLFL